MKLTQEEFDKLPALLTRKLFLEITGLSKNDLPLLVAKKAIRIYRVRAYAKYYRDDAAKCIGLKK